jgi:hypothetical protein
MLDAGTLHLMRNSCNTPGHKMGAGPIQPTRPTKWLHRATEFGGLYQQQ